MKKLLFGLALCVAAVAVAFVTFRNAVATPLNGVADRIVVIKHEHTMALYQGAILLQTYRVSLGRGGLGPKVHAGDNRVPEGVYRIVGHNAHSAFHRALRIGYPTPQQVADARRRGVDPGGDIMIHGIRNGLGWLGALQRRVDWTKGCIALTDEEMDRVFQAVPDGTPVTIVP